jgi:TolB-like protein/Tfp pilus assembly protein PilF
LTDSGLGDEALKAAQAQIAELDHVLLSRFQVVGNYVRYDENARNILKDMRQKILEGFHESSKGSRNYLVWGEPGCGKSYFVEQIADSIRGIDYDEINLTETDEAKFRTELSRTESTSQQALCLVDEVDAKLGEPWPYEVLLRHLEAPKTVSKQVCFILAGSSGNSLDDMVTRIEKRPKGVDLLSRIPVENRVSIPSLTFGDRMIVALCQLLKAATEKGIQVHEVEKLALYYLTVNPRLGSARHLRDFALRCVQRIPRGEDRVKFDYLFSAGDPENKEFWNKTQNLHKQLANSFLLVSPGHAYPETEKKASEAHQRIAVLPLSSISPDPNDEYFADGMTEELISTVSKIGQLRTISRTSAMRYKGTKVTLKEIANELNVDAILEGSVRKAGSRLRINVQLIDVKQDEHLWSQSYDRELQDVFAIQSDIANKVADALHVHLLVQEKQSIENKATSNIESYTLYLKGLHSRGKRTEEGYTLAIKYFEEAIKKDPGFALAYAGMADCYERMGEDGMLPPKDSFPRAREYALKSIQLDNSLAEAHATLGAVLEEYYFDIAAAEDEFRLALGLNPNYGMVCHSYGAHLACVGRLDEAIAEIGRAQELNPLALEVHDCAAVIFNCANQFDKSVDACDKMFSIDENYLPAYQDLAEAYLEESRFDEAIQVLQKAITISKGASTAKARLGYAYARAGRELDARKVLRELEQDSKQRYVSPVAFAVVHCGLGDKDQAIECLERARQERAGGLLSVKVRPLWANLRSEPGFKDLVNKIGLNTIPREDP